MLQVEREEVGSATEGMGVPEAVVQEADHTQKTEETEHMVEVAVVGPAHIRVRPQEVANMEIRARVVLAEVRSCPTLPFRWVLPMVQEALLEEMRAVAEAVD